jgi:hypothetical protein
VRDCGGIPANRLLLFEEQQANARVAALIFRAVAQDTRKRKVEYPASVNHVHKVIFKTM